MLFRSPQEAMSPVSSEEVVCTAEPELIRLSGAAASQEELTEWAMDVVAAPVEKMNVLAKQRIITTLSGTGAPPPPTDYRLSSAEIRAIGSVADVAEVQFRLRGLNSAGQFAIAKTAPILVSMQRLREVRNGAADTTQFASASTNVQDQPQEQISRFALTFFDFDKSTLNAQNAQILNVVKSRVSSSVATEAIIVGYTDRVGDAVYNKRLSTDRAKTVADLLSGVSASRKAVSGVGEAIQLYDNDFPEGRFYCRMVEIVLRSVKISSNNQSEP